jgi:hypothetical protein
MKIGKTDHIIVGNANNPHPGCSKILQYRATQTARANHQYTPGKQFVLPCIPKTGKDGLPLISLI